MKRLILLLTRCAVVVAWAVFGYANATAAPRSSTVSASDADGACLIAPTDGSTRYVPVQASSLFSTGNLQFEMGRVRHGDSLATVLAYETSSKDVSPVATIALAGEGASSKICIDLLARTDAGADRVLAVATLEHVYNLVLREDPWAAYCLADKIHQCSFTAKGLPQGDMLRELVRMREHELSDGLAGVASKPWQVVMLSPTGVGSSDDLVRARIAGKDGPMQGMRLFFHKAPHSGCNAMSDANGVASCQLVNFHGDDDGDENKDPKLLVTFPGESDSHRVLVPTTFVMQMQ